MRDGIKMKLLAIALLTVILVSSTVLSHDLFAKSKDSKAKSAIIKAIGKAVEGKYSTIKLIQLSKSNVTGYVIVYNTTKALPPTPTPTPTPVPNPPANASTTKVCLVGDLKGSTVPNMMKDCNYKIGLGDLGYGSDLSYFKGLKFDRCVVGNHDSPEDGSSSIYKEALAYCGDHWNLKPNSNTLIMGFNTNGDINSQLTAAKSTFTNPQIMNGVKVLIFVSHKGGHVPPNSHHPAEAKSLYSQLEAIVPSSVKVIEVFGHNHVSSSAPSMNWYQAGAGGKSFYSCGTDAVWTYCDNKSEQYLALTIDNNSGATAAKFVK
jgi:hypothetical protein